MSKSPRITALLLLGSSLPLLLAQNSTMNTTNTPAPTPLRTLEPSFVDSSPPSDYPTYGWNIEPWQPYTYPPWNYNDDIYGSHGNHGNESPGVASPFVIIIPIIVILGFLYVCVRANARRPVVVRPSTPVATTSNGLVIATPATFDFEAYRSRKRQLVMDSAEQVTPTSNTFLPWDGIFTGQYEHQGCTKFIRVNLQFTNSAYPNVSIVFGDGQSTDGSFTITQGLVSHETGKAYWMSQDCNGRQVVSDGTLTEDAFTGRWQDEYGQSGRYLSLVRAPLDGSGSATATPSAVVLAADDLVTVPLAYAEPYNSQSFRPEVAVVDAEPVLEDHSPVNHQSSSSPSNEPEYTI